MLNLTNLCLCFYAFSVGAGLNYAGAIEGISAASVSPHDVPKSNLLPSTTTLGISI